MTRKTTLFALALAALASCATADAREPRQAPVELADRWVTLERGAFVLSGSSERIAILEDLAATAETNMPWIAESVGLGRVRPVHIVLVPDSRAARQSPTAQWLRAIAPEWAKGYAPPDTSFIAIYGQHWPDLGGGAPNFMRETLVHELAHVAIYQLGGSTLPKWLQEGAATWVSLLWRGYPGGYARAEHAQIALLSAREEEDWWALHDQWGSGIYLAAGDFVSWLHGLNGDALRATIGDGVAGSGVWRREFGYDVESLFSDWSHSVLSRQH